MARPKKAQVTETITTPQASGWTRLVKIKKALIVPYRISGKVDDVVEVPIDLVDELVRLKKVELV